MFKICFQDVFKRFLQDVLKTSWKTKSFHAKDVLKKSSRHVLNTSSRRLQDQQVFVGSLYNRRELETKIDRWTKVSILKKEMKSNSVQFVMSHTVLTETSLRKFPVGLRYKWLEQDLNSRPLSSHLWPKWLWVQILFQLNNKYFQINLTKWIQPKSVTSCHNGV